MNPNVKPSPSGVLTLGGCFALIPTGQDSSGDGAYLLPKAHPFISFRTTLQPRYPR